MTSIRLPAHQDPQLRQIPCPVLRTLVNEGRLTPDAQGQVDLAQLNTALEQIGVGGIVRKVLVGGAHGQGKEQAARFLTKTADSTFNILRLTGGSLDHAGDTRILRGGFNEERLKWLVSFSSDGKRLSIDDVARAQKAARTEEPAGFRGALLGVAELCAVMLVFGTPDARGVKGISNEALTSLYRDAKIPPGFEPRSVGGLELVATMAKVAFTQAFTTSGRATMGMDKALGREELLDRTSAKGLQSAMCPAGMRPSTKPQPLSATEAQKLHS
jgi:hypothetical protein